MLTALTVPVPIQCGLLCVPVVVLVGADCSDRTSTSPVRCAACFTTSLTVPVPVLYGLLCDSVVLLVGTDCSDRTSTSFSLHIASYQGCVTRKHKPISEQLQSSCVTRKYNLTTKRKGMYNPYNPKKFLCPIFLSSMPIHFGLLVHTDMYSPYFPWKFSTSESIPLKPSSQHA